MRIEVLPLEKKIKTAVAMLALSDKALAQKLAEFRKKQSEAVRKAELPKA